MVEPRKVGTIAEFDELLRGEDDRVVMVQFTAGWCPLTNVFRPFIATMSLENDKYLLVQVNIEDSPV